MAFCKNLTLYLMQALILQRKPTSIEGCASLVPLVISDSKSSPRIEYYGGGGGGGGRGNGGNVGGFYHTSALCEAHSSKPNGAQRAS
ncbi:hypothetical protein M0802_004623 [Mischocyttarus mexicanus]|nr:hypothetical protein M0802_004623 [Mischocyttarus mexicanus]